MKTKITLFLLLSIGLAVQANDLTQLQFTRSDGTVYQTRTLPPYPESPTYLGTDQQYSGINGIGSKTNTYNGASYHIDIAKNELILGDGFDIGSLIWNGNPVDVGTYYGFAIDNRGRGWLVTNANDGDSQYYLFRVDLSNAVVTYVDVIDPGNTTYPLNGLIVLTP